MKPETADADGPGQAYFRKSTQTGLECAEHKGYGPVGWGKHGFAMRSPCIDVL